MKALLFMTTAALWLSTVSLSASTAYTITTFSIPGSVYTFAAGINDAGQIAGIYGTAPGPNGILPTYSYLDTAGGITTLQTGIIRGSGPNNAGQLVGESSTCCWIDFYSGGTYTKVIPAGATQAYPIAISNSGQVLGSATNTSSKSKQPNVYYYFLYSAGNYQTMTLPGTPTGINLAGQIVGNISSTDPNGNPISTGFVYANGTYKTLPFPAGSTSVTATGINDLGEVVGSYADSAGTSHGFVYSSATYTTIDGPGASHTSTESIIRV